MGRRSRAIKMEPAGKSFGEIVNVDEFEKRRGGEETRTDGAWWVVIILIGE